MRTIIKGKNLKVSKDLKQRLEEKLEKIERHKHFVTIKELEVEFSVEKNPGISANQAVEITVFTKGPVLRAREASGDMSASIDKVIDKIDRQIEKYKGKVYRSKNHKGRHKAIELKHKGPTNEVEKMKYSTRSMTVEEARIQMELLQNDFYVFLNSENDEINILYYRKDGRLRLMEPE